MTWDSWGTPDFAFNLKFFFFFQEFVKIYLRKQFHEYKMYEANNSISKLQKKKVQVFSLMCDLQKGTMLNTEQCVLCWSDLTPPMYHTPVICADIALIYSIM